jgi:hypothetical protein
MSLLFTFYEMIFAITAVEFDLAVIPIDSVHLNQFMAFSPADSTVACFGIFSV